MSKRKDPPPVRPDVAMDRALERSRTRLASYGIHPDRLPWHWVGGVLIDNATGRPLAHQYDYNPKNPPAPHFDRWTHKVLSNRNLDPDARGSKRHKKGGTK